MCAACGCYYFTVCRQWHERAGILVAVASAIKVTPVLLAFMNPSRHAAARLIASTVAAGAVLAALSVAVFGVDWHRDFIDAQQEIQDRDRVTNAGGLDFVDPGFSDWPDPNASPFTILARMAAVAKSASISNALADAWNGVEVVIAVVTLALLFRAARARSESPELPVVAFTALILLPLVASKVTWAVYAAPLVLSLALFATVLRLGWLSRLVVLLSFTGFAAWEHLLYPGHLMPGPIQSIMYILNPAAIAYVLLFGVTLVLLYRLGSKPVVDEVATERAASAV
jgi:hypothetical protein